MEYISQGYLELNKQLHASNPGYGRNGYRHLDAIVSLAEQLNTKDILDYGCGKSTLAINLGFNIKQYDPAVFEYSELPEPADIVTCTDVLEHIEPYYLENVLDHLRALTKKVCFVTVSTIAAKKTLPDGRNAHLIQKPVRWWMERIWDRFEVINLIVTDIDFRAVLTVKN